MKSGNPREMQNTRPCVCGTMQTTRNKVYSDGTMAGLALHSHDSARDGHVKLLPRHPVLPAMPVALV